MSTLKTYDDWLAWQKEVIKEEARESMESPEAAK